MALGPGAPAARHLQQKMQEFEAGFLDDIRRHKKELLDAIRETGQFEESTEQALDEAVTVIDPETMREVPRDWALIDFDSLPAPAGLYFAQEPQRAAECGAAQLVAVQHRAADRRDRRGLGQRRIVAASRVSGRTSTMRARELAS